jgi:ABC-type transporter Mla maintaining outer membrane lipid asymmetry permease subunit MlaE
MLTMILTGLFYAFGVAGGILVGISIQGQSRPQSEAKASKRNQ